MMKKLIISFLVFAVLLSFAPIPVQAFSFVPCGTTEDIGTLDEQCQFGHLFIMIYRVINYLITMAGIVAMYQIISAGFNMISSVGNTEKIALAKTGISNAVVGFGVVVLSFVFVNLLINGVLGSGDGPKDRKWWDAKCLYDITDTTCPGTKSFIKDYDRSAGGGGGGGYLLIPLPVDLDGKVRAAAANNGLEYCFVRAIVQKESSGKPDAIGHDHTAPPPPIKRWQSASDGAKASEPNNAHDKFSLVPDLHNLDWDFSHGIGLMQITIFPKSHALGKAGWKGNTPAREMPDGSGKRYTVQDLLNVDKQITAATEHLAQLYRSNGRNYEKAAARYNGTGAKADKYGKDIMRDTNLCKNQQ